MNNERRKAIAAVRGEIETLVDQFDSIKTQLEDIRDEEQDYFDNMPESFQQGDKGQAAEEAISNLDNAIDALDVQLDDAINYLEEAAA